MDNNFFNLIDQEEDLKDIALHCTNWTDWRETMLMVISDMEAINQECEEWSVQDNSLNGGGQ
mgnify:CR=1 FL=1